MNRRIGTITTLAITLILTLTGPPAFADDDFCWKDSYGRGVGTVPRSCAPGREMIGLLCYSTCPGGTTRVGFDCHSLCPNNMRNDGLFCRAAEYGRGSGYPWKFGDALNDNGMISRCEADNGRGNCEKNGLMYYPKCKPGYSAFGCCICRPNPPNCAALGLNAGIDLSCAKRVSIGDPVPGVCGNSQDYDAGLCYSKCNASYNGLGPVCWGQCPASHPVTCGAGCATSQDACAQNTSDQVMSVLEGVANVGLAVATAGTSTGATAAANAAKTAARTGARFAGRMTKAEVANVIREKAKELGKDVAESAIQTYAEATVQAGITGEFDPSILAGLDPTGIASIVVAYAKPVCGSPVPPPPQAPPPATRPPGSTSRVAPPRQPAPAPPQQLSVSIGGGPASQPPPAVSPAYVWVSSSGAVPGNAIIGGQEVNRSLPICRGAYQGGLHPGKVVDRKCNFGYAGNEISVARFEILTGDGARLEWAAGPSAPNMVVGGGERGGQLWICRAAYEGGVHPGKVIGGQCNIGYGGKEISLPGFDVLRQR